MPPCGSAACRSDQLLWTELFDLYSVLLMFVFCLFFFVCFLCFVAFILFFMVWGFCYEVTVMWFISFIFLWFGVSSLLCVNCRKI